MRTNFNFTPIAFILPVIVFLFSSCIAEYEDISNSPEAKALVGRDYILLRPLVAHGIADFRNLSEEVEYYVLMPPPGIAGPEVVERLEISEGSHVSVTKVMKCSNCFLVKPMYVVLEFTDNDKLKEEVRTRNLTYLNKATKGVELDDSYFVSSPR
jgi:hypothetical protein